MSRERLVLALDGKERFGGPRLDRESMEWALRAGRSGRRSSDVRRT
jgi:hypothetical protein